MLKNILKFVSLTLAAAMSFSCFETGVSAVDEPVPEYEADFSREDDYMNTITDYAMAAFSAEAEEPELVYSDIPIEKFQVSNLSPQTVTDIDYTDWWYSEWDDCRYIFLPATADRNDLIITYQSENGELTLNGNKVVSGASTSLLSEADEFDIKVSNTDCGKLKIMQSNLGCIYL